MRQSQVNPVDTANESSSSILKRHSCFFFKTDTASQSFKSRCPFTKRPKQKGRDQSKIGSKIYLADRSKENRGRKRNLLSSDEKEWLMEFLNRSNITYTNPGRKDHAYVGKLEGQRQCTMNNMHSFIRFTTFHFTRCYT